MRREEVTTVEPGGWWIIALVDVVGAVVNLLLMFRHWRAWSSEEWYRKEEKENQ